MVQKNFLCGMELCDVKLRPSEVAVHVTQVVDGNKWVGELVGDYLSTCLGQIVYWCCILVCWTEILELETRIRGRERRDCPVSLEFALVFYFCDVEQNVSSSILIPSSTDHTSTPERNFYRTTRISRKHCKW